MDPYLQTDSLQESQQVFSGEAEYSVVIKNYTGKEFPVGPSAFLSFNIFESLMDENVMHGDITLLDSAGFEERVPFIGEETIRVDFFNKRMPKTKFSAEFVIYKMSEKVIQNKSQVYTLFFISEEFISNLKNKISKSYKGKTSQEMVQDIYDNYIVKHLKKTNSKELFYDSVGNSDGAFLLGHYVFPYVRPFQAINLIAKKSLASTVNLGSNQSSIANYGSFVFFENQKGFWFKSIGDLINPQFTRQGAEFEESQQEVIEDGGADARLVNAAARENKNKLRVETSPKTASVDIPMAVYTITPADNMGTSPASSDRIVSSFKFLSVFDILSNIAGGMYGSRLLTYDPITQMVGEDNLNFTSNVTASKREPRLMLGGQKAFYNEYGYLDEYENFRHIRETTGRDGEVVGGHPLVSNGHVGLGGFWANYKYKSTNFRHEIKQHINMLEREMTPSSKNFDRYDNQVERTILTTNAQRRMMKNIVVEIRVQGDHNRTIGEIVELKIPSYAYPDEPGHTYYRGNYLITKIKHNVNGDGLFNTEMQLVKDSLFTKLENDDNLDSSGNTPSSEDSEIAKQAEADLIESVGPEQNFGDSSFRIITNKDGSTRVSGRL